MHLNNFKEITNFFLYINMSLDWKRPNNLVMARFNVQFLTMVTLVTKITNYGYMEVTKIM